MSGPSFSGQTCPYCHSKLTCFDQNAEHICPGCGAFVRFETVTLYTAVGVAQGSCPPPPDFSSVLEPDDAKEIIRDWERRHRRPWKGDRSYPFNRHYVYGDGVLDDDWKSKAER